MAQKTIKKQVYFYEVSAVDKWNNKHDYVMGPYLNKRSLKQLVLPHYMKSIELNEVLIERTILNKKKVL